MNVKAQGLFEASPFVPPIPKVFRILQEQPASSFQDILLQEDGSFPIQITPQLRQFLVRELDDGKWSNTMVAMPPFHLQPWSALTRRPKNILRHTYARHEEHRKACKNLVTASFVCEGIDDASPNA